MEKKKVWMQEMSWKEVGDYLAKDEIVLVPIGSTEVHGSHMPLGHDTYQAIDFAEGIAREAGVLCAPPIWYGDSPHHMGKPGTISLQGETIIHLLKDVYQSLYHHGFKSIITFNGHRLANIPAIKIASSALKQKYESDIFLAIMDPLVMAVEVMQNLLEEPGGNQEARLAEEHGGEWEASHLLFKRPELVNMDLAEVVVPEPLLQSRFIDKPDFEGGDRMIIISGHEDQTRVTLNKGFVGDPTVASAKKGETIYKSVVKNGVEFIEDIRRRKQNSVS